MKDEELRKLAKLRASFKIHSTVYIVIILFLAGINYLTYSGYPWFLWPALGWGIAVLLHGLAAYVWNTDLEEKEYQKLKAKQKKK
jgi:hypothetical protein